MKIPCGTLFFFPLFLKGFSDINTEVSLNDLLINRDRVAVKVNVIPCQAKCFGYSKSGIPTDHDRDVKWPVVFHRFHDHFVFIDGNNFSLFWLPAVFRVFDTLTWVVFYIS